MRRSDQVKLLFAVILLGMAGFGFARFFKRPAGEGKAYFYDLSGQKLFIAPHNSVPPIQGPVGSEEDGVRAVLVSRTGNPEDKEIAYLEMYNPLLKKVLEARRAGITLEGNPEISRTQSQEFTLIRRPKETEWHSMNSAEAQAILASVVQPGPDGKVPVICVP